MIIDLGELAKDQDRDTISGRETGIAARDRLGIRNLAPTEEMVIRIPAHIRVVTPSFFIGLLAGAFPPDAMLLQVQSAVHLEGASPTTSTNLEYAIRTMFRKGSPFDALHERRAK